MGIIIDFQCGLLDLHGLSLEIIYIALSHIITGKNEFLSLSRERRIAHMNSVFSGGSGDKLISCDRFYDNITIRQVVGKVAGIPLARVRRSTPILSPSNSDLRWIRRFKCNLGCRSYYRRGQ